MPCPTVEQSDDSPQQYEDEGEGERSTSYNSEESVSAAIVIKFLSKIGLIVKDVCVRVIPHEHQTQNIEFDKLPTVMFRLKHLRVYKQQCLDSQTEAVKLDLDDEEMKDVQIDSPRLEANFSTDIVPEEPEPIPDILNILEGKTLEIGQFSVHLLPCPFDIRSSNESSGHEGDFPFIFPHINHISTILC